MTMVDYESFEYWHKHQMSPLVNCFRGSGTEQDPIRFNRLNMGLKLGLKAEVHHASSTVTIQPFKNMWTWLIFYASMCM